MKICFVFLLSCIILSSCNSDNDLKRSVFIPDQDAPQLPIYSESGFNTFGAYYDRNPIVSNNTDLPLKIIVNEGTTNFVFKGQRGSGYYNYGGPVTITLRIARYDPTTYHDLQSLSGKTVDVTNSDIEVSYEEAGVASNIQLLNGKFEFKRAQDLLVDKKPTELILSGVFEFQMLVNGEPVSVSEGRFDIGVGSYNFFKY
jgi:hypothetical protein